jgi:hypothetical protein
MFYLRDHTIHGILIDIGNDNSRTFPGQIQGELPPHAVAGPCDNGNFLIESFFHTLHLCTQRSPYR